MSNPGRAAPRKRGATEVTAKSTFRAGQSVAVEAAAFGDFDGVAQGTVRKTDRFGRVVSRYARTVPKNAVSHIPTSLGNAGGGRVDPPIPITPS